MKKLLVIQKKRGLYPNWPVLLSVLVFLFVLLSCNNESKTDNTTTDSTADLVDTTAKTTLAGDGGAAIASFNGNFPYLTLSKSDLTTFFTPANVQKLVFRFQFDDGNSLPSLVAFQATSVRVYNPTPLSPRLTKESLTKSLSGELFLGNLELTKTQYTNLMAASGGSNTIIFEPKLKGANVVYGIAWSTTFNKDSVATMSFQPSFDLNPSPPDPPAGSN